MIVAMDKLGTIGFNNDLPWGRGLKDDLANFRRLTTGKTVIMGRRTFESIGSKPLPNRQNIVLTRTPTGVKGVLSAASLEAAYALAQYDIAVIGGAQVYAAALGDIDELVITYVDAEFPDATVFFPLIDQQKWHEIKCQHYDADERNAYAFDIVTYKRA